MCPAFPEHDVRPGRQVSDTWLSDLATRDGLAAAVNEMLALLPARNRWCVEFGAWDGKLASNTRDLIVGQAYSAVLIEGDRSKFRELQANYANRPDVTTINAVVGFGERDSLDTILTRTGLPRTFDFLSIDIDGNDYHVWRATTQYRPQIVCIEFNTTIPPEVSFVQAADPSVAQGSSLTALVELGTSKGYELIAVIGVNAFFVVRECFDAFHVNDNRIGSLWLDRSQVTYLFSGYDGTMFLSGSRMLPWYEVALSERRIQHVPAFLRGFPYPKWKRWAYLAATDPSYLARRVRLRIRRLFGC
ncbi:MAG: hypothetical protein WBD07_14745 [Vicinamibacterales bacterium]